MSAQPSRLQTAIRKVFELATSRIRIQGTEVVAYPLFRALDGSDTSDYVQRVEPSPRGGAKIAHGLMDFVFGPVGHNTAAGLNTVGEMQVVMER